jgi:hypothetical protein
MCSKSNPIVVFFHKSFKEELISILLKFFHKIKREGILLGSFYETSIMLILKPNKDFTRKKNYRPVSLINIHAKTLNKILANRIQQHANKIIHHDQVSLILGMERWFNICKSINLVQHISSSKDKKSHDLLTDAEKPFDKIQYPFIIKSLKKLGIERMFFNTIKAIYDKHRANVILNGEQLKLLPLNSGTRQSCLFSLFLFKIVLEFLDRAIQQQQK